MRTFIVAFFAFLAMSQCFDPARDFITAFFKSAQGKDVTLSDKCFGADFDRNYQRLLKYVEAENYSLLIVTVQKIALDVYQNCPVAEAKAIAEIIINKIKDKSILTDLMPKLTEVAKILVAEYKSKDYSGKALGTAAGSSIAVFIKANLEIVQKFLGLLEVKSELEPFSIVEGFLLGLGKDETSTKCHDDVIKSKDAMIQVVKELIEAIKSGKDIVQAIMAAFSKLISMGGLVSDCRLLNLVEAVKQVASKQGLLVLLQRVQENSTALLDIAVKIMEAAKTQDGLVLGNQIGQIVKILLDFYVN